MVEIAPGLYQCGYCGYGPSQNGHREFYSLHYLELSGDVVDGLCVRYDVWKGIYVMTSLSWRLDDNGARANSWLKEELVGFAAVREELEKLPLPVVVMGKHKYDLHENTPPLRKMMFDSPYGPKVMVLSPEGVRPPSLSPLTAGRSFSG